MKSLKHSFQTKPGFIHVFQVCYCARIALNYLSLLVFILKFDLALISVRHDSNQRHQDASRTDFTEIQGNNL